jgi:hypothetical protein
MFAVGTMVDLIRSLLVNANLSSGPHRNMFSYGLQIGFPWYRYIIKDRLSKLERRGSALYWAH